MICCLTGMHRSGTSLLASWLHNCGLVVVKERGILPDQANPKGYFEDLDFVGLHNRSVARQLRWTSGWRAAPRQSLCFSENEIGQALRLVQSRQTDSQSWGWKDPRSLLFLPQWKEIIPDLKVIIIWRPAAEVAYSLLSRWKNRPSRLYWVDPFSALKVWNSHNRLACAYAAAWPKDTLLAPLSGILTHDQDFLNHINQFFNADLNYSALSEIAESKLLHGGRTPAWLAQLSRMMGCMSVEAQLKKLSWLEQGDGLRRREATHG